VNRLELTGRTASHVIPAGDPQCLLHVQVAAPFLALRRAALTEGFDLVAQSGFRDFSRQLAIWNDKFSGRRPLYGSAGEPLDAAALTPAGRVDAILLWSALPGASRHHWGTDVDLIDRGALRPGYRVQLNAAEFAPGGPFAALGGWLEANAARFGFFRPYRGVASGVAAEPWHYSFAPVAENARRALTSGVLSEALEASPILGKDQVLGRLEELHSRYVAAIDWP
jgi:LAS superfamily LD-carboxypeptidase LdcB